MHYEDLKKKGGECLPVSSCSNITTLGSNNKRKYINMKRAAKAQHFM